MVNKYYQKHKEKLRKEACERYQNLSEEEKEKNIGIIVNIIINFLKKKKKVEYMRNSYVAHKK